ncbi:MAG: hypothetical protein ACFNXY_12565 [Corynebacterium matruchotii]|uniref:hypothetical protein n=1 Tax=Corynebacterium matruchotii TaxID=43768 RepID=UPI00361DAA8B
MDFTKSGIPGFSVSDSFADVKQRLDIVRAGNDFGFESVMGYFELGGNRYLMGATQNPVTHDISCVEVRMFFDGDTFEGIALGEMTAQEFAGELAKIGSVPIMEDIGIWWVDERVCFYVYEDVPSTICWWGTDPIVDEVKTIFSGKIEDLDPNVYHLYKAEE